METITVGSTKYDSEMGIDKADRATLISNEKEC